MMTEDCIINIHAQDDYSAENDWSNDHEWNERIDDNEHIKDEKIVMLIVDNMLNNIFCDVYIKLCKYTQNYDGNIDCDDYKYYVLQLLKECKDILKLHALFCSLSIQTLYYIMHVYNKQYKNVIHNFDLNTSSYKLSYDTLECLCFKLGYVKQAINTRLAYCEP